jgi:hypothetical protein
MPSIGGRLGSHQHGSENKLALCAQFVPRDVASGDLSDSVDIRISNLRRMNAWVRFAPLPAP